MSGHHTIFLVCPILLIVLLTTQNVPAQEEYVTTGRAALNNVFHRLAKYSGDTYTITEREVAKAQPVFIFIPGILGSKLVTRDGKVLWGMTPVEEENLAYSPDQGVVTDLLEDYEILTIVPKLRWI